MDEEQSRYLLGNRNNHLVSSRLSSGVLFVGRIGAACNQGDSYCHAQEIKGQELAAMLADLSPETLVDLHYSDARKTWEKLRRQEVTEVPLRCVASNLLFAGMTLS